MSDEDLWTFNGIDARTGEYLLELPNDALISAALGEPLDAGAIREQKFRRDRASENHFGVKEGVDVRSLAETGWAVIFPAVAAGSEEERAQAAIREALQPLLDLRKQQAGQYYKEYRGAEGVRPNESKPKYMARLGAAPGPANPEKVPYYLLLVADPRAVSFRFQSQLSVQYAVGRLWFPTLEEYANYARSVVAAETPGRTLPRRLHFFGVANSDDRPTQASSEHLIAPLADLFQADAKSAAWTIERSFAAAATQGALSELLHRDAPALLFTASHGMSFPKDDPLQLRRQGAILCQDWPGPRSWREPIPERFYFAGDHLAADADLHGTIAFLFACYGAGTPELNEFALQDRRERAAIAPHPFVAGLPTAMLGRPRGGALAVIGHVERAWGQSFMWAGTGAGGKVGRQITVFESALRGLMTNMPVGAAMEAFDERYAELSTDLSDRLEEIKHETAVPDQELVSMWTANNDARGYAILGDPAVRAMVGDGAPTGRVPAPAISATTTATATVTTTTVTTATTTVAPEADAEATSFGLIDRIMGKPKDPDTAAPAPDDGSGTLRGFLAKLGTTIQSALTDMTTLEVSTYTTSDLQSIDVQGDQVRGAKRRAYTRISLDGDTIVCVPEDDDGVVDRELFDIHQATVKQAQAARTQLLRTIVQAAGSLFGGK